MSYISPPPVNVAEKIAAFSAGAVGSFTFARRTGGTGDIALGNTIAGASLSSVGAPCEWVKSTADNNWTVQEGAVMTGTWRAMAAYDHNPLVTGGGSTYYGASLFMRIA